MQQTTTLLGSNKHQQEDSGWYMMNMTVHTEDGDAVVVDRRRRPGKGRLDGPYL